MAGKDNVAPFEFIPWILGQCVSVAEAKQRISRMNLINISCSEQLPLSPLHWMISDPESSIVVESLEEGLRIYDNPFEVLTNNPTFDYHRMHLNNFMALHVGPADNQFQEASFQNYSLGMGAMGLPGDWSSASRFVRAAFVRGNSVCGQTEEESVSQFFHILGAVEHPCGVVRFQDQIEITVYTSCCNTDKGIYYYTTYENCGITGVDMHKEDLESAALITYPMRKDLQVLMEN